MSINIEQSVKYNRQAAVLIAITEICGEDHVLLTKRAEHLTHHGGEVSFPGGMWEPQDEDLLQTALRETHEEVGLHPDRVDVLAELGVCQTRQGVRVTPFTGAVDSSDGLEPNIGELDSLFWVPLSFLEEDRRVRTDLFQINGKEYWSPVYQFEEFEIWGFTARLIVDFLNQFRGQLIERPNVAPEKLYVPPGK